MISTVVTKVKSKLLPCDADLVHCERALDMVSFLENNFDSPV